MLRKGWRLPSIQASFSCPGGDHCCHLLSWLKHGWLTILYFLLVLQDRLLFSQKIFPENFTKSREITQGKGKETQEAQSTFLPVCAFLSLFSVVLPWTLILLVFSADTNVSPPCLYPILGPALMPGCVSGTRLPCFCWQFLFWHSGGLECQEWDGAVFQGSNQLLTDFEHHV